MYNGSSVDEETAWKKSYPQAAVNVGKEKHGRDKF
jgi:hypothetical protein